MYDSQQGIPKSPVKVPPAKKKFRRRFKPVWRVGCPWLMHANGLMWCLACRAYPQPGMRKAWQKGTHSLRRRTILEHSNSVHQQRPTRAGMGTPGPIANIRLRI